MKEKFRIKFTNDDGSTYFDDMQIEGSQNAAVAEATSSPGGTEYIHNKGTTIKAVSKSESGGDNVIVWLKIQEV